MLASLHLDLFSMPCGVKNALRLVFSQTNIGLHSNFSDAEIIDILRVADAKARAHPGWPIARP